MHKATPAVTTTTVVVVAPFLAMVCETRSKQRLREGYH